MIRYTQGDILQADAEALVNTVNCVGVMGRGIALQFRQAFPENFKAYAAACERGEVEPGKMFVFDTGQLAPRWIINFPTKKHWRGKSKLEYIETGMEAFVEEVKTRNIRSVAIPPLGSGLGGLNWSQVRSIIEDRLSDLPDVDALVFEPSDVKSEPQAKVRPRMTAGRAALVGLIKRYLTAMMDPHVTLLEIHKLMYFLQSAGEPLRLKYVKAPYGPYAENLRHVLRAVNGHLINGYSAAGDSPTEEIQLVSGAVESAEQYLAKHQDTQGRFERVATLVEGFETPFGLELLATAHWVMSTENVNLAQVTKAVYDWAPRKRQFTGEQIEIAIERLQEGEWLNGTPHPTA